MTGTAPRAKVLLKARPTKAQLADRMALPRPPGLELYLDAADLAPERLGRLAEPLIALRPSPDFVFLVEGPLRSLDGSFFDISVNSEANRECVRRISWLAGEIGAEAVLIHAITPRKLTVSLTQQTRRWVRDVSLPFLENYVTQARQRGLIPLLENIPPVARQREAAYMCTPVGMSAEDLVFFAGKFPGLKVTLDVSHAQLFLNGLRMSPADAGPHLAPLLEYLTTFEDDPTIDAYITTLEPHLFSAHFSNARGLLDEGLPYGDGDLDLDAVTRRLSRLIPYLVTETIEPDANVGVHMREAQRRMEAAVAAEEGVGVEL